MQMPIQALMAALHDMLKLGGQGVGQPLPTLGLGGEGAGQPLPTLGLGGQGMGQPLPTLGLRGQGVGQPLPTLESLNTADTEQAAMTSAVPKQQTVAVPVLPLAAVACHVPHHMDGHVEHAASSQQQGCGLVPPEANCSNTTCDARTLDRFTWRDR